MDAATKNGGDEMSFESVSESMKQNIYFCIKKILEEKGLDVIELDVDFYPRYDLQGLPTGIIIKGAFK